VARHTGFTQRKENTVAQVLLDFADPHGTPAHDSLEADGFAIGWDHAHYALVPPVEHLAISSPVRAGWQAGRAAFARRALAATPAVNQWLQLRLQAWLHGLAFEAVQVTPHYLRQLAATHCPVSRDALSDAVVERMRLDAGIAAGNLAVVSVRVQAARQERDWRAALAVARQLDSDARLFDAGRAADALTVGGLTAAQWRRLAVLGSFVTPLAHDEASALPLLVLPPNRLRLFNPVQALQALVTRLLVGEGFAQRAARLEALIPGETARRDFRRFVHAFLPRVLTAGRLADRQALHWALEDAWTDGLVIARWQRFAQQLAPSQCEHLLQRAAARGISPTRMLDTPEPLATEGWALDVAGRATPHCARRAPGAPLVAPRSMTAAAQACLPL
jgi:hypothetical protein